MKKLVLVAALTAGFSLTANANQFSDYLDSQYETSWAEETQFEVFSSVGVVDQLAGYQTEGAHEQFNLGATTATGSVVDIAAMEIVGKPMSQDDDDLFVDSGE